MWFILFWTSNLCRNPLEVQHRKHMWKRTSERSPSWVPIPLARMLHPRRQGFLHARSLCACGSACVQLHVYVGCLSCTSIHSYCTTQLLPRTQTFSTHVWPMGASWSSRISAQLCVRPMGLQGRNIARSSSFWHDLLEPWPFLAMRPWSAFGLDQRLVLLLLGEPPSPQVSPWVSSSLSCFVSGLLCGRLCLGKYLGVTLLSCFE